MLEAIEGGVEGPLLNLQLVAGDLLNPQQHAVAVQRTQ